MIDFLVNCWYAVERVCQAIYKNSEAQVLVLNIYNKYWSSSQVEDISGLIFDLFQSLLSNRKT